MCFCVVCLVVQVLFPNAQKLEEAWEQKDGQHNKGNRRDCGVCFFFPEVMKCFCVF